VSFPGPEFLNLLASFDLQSDMEDFLPSLRALSFKLTESGSILLLEPDEDLTEPRPTVLLKDE